MMRLIDELTEGKGSTFILFGTMPSLASLAQSPRPVPNILTRAWHRTGHPDFFIDRS